MRAWALASALALTLAGCRTEVRPAVKAVLAKSPEREAPGACVVNDYRSAVDVPAGSTNLGWVVVPRQATDDETFQRLREAVCAKGGTALSQAHWNRPAGATVADPPAELEANAWLEP
jgi:hypothetical protein